MLVPIYMVIYMVIYSKMGPQVTGLALSKPVLSRWVISLPNGCLWALHISWISEDPSLLYEIIQLSNNGTTSAPPLFFSHWYFIKKQEKFGNLFCKPMSKTTLLTTLCLLQLKGNQGCLLSKWTLTWHFHFLALLECFLSALRVWGLDPGPFLRVKFLCCCFCCWVTKSFLTLCNPMDCSAPCFPVLHYLPEFAQIHVHWVGDAIQPSHRLLTPSPNALNLFQVQALFQ